MNYALPFCRGDIVGVYDAEDRPDPGQIRAVVAATCRRRRRRSPACRATSTSTTPRTTGCRAASPSNTRSGSGWCCSGCSGSGCRSRSAAPASSSAAACSSRSAAWDAHNVTEDADLGMRLARFGYRCEMIASTTWEEANCRALAVDQAALALAQGLRADLGHAHAPAARALARPRAARLPRLPGALPRRRSPRTCRCRCSGRSGRRALGFGLALLGAASRPG